MRNFTKRQWLTLIVIGFADFCNAICVSIQAPFYPQEAENKGCTATEYGLVFGVFELVVFLISPAIGQHINRLGPKLLFNGGIYTTGVCSILFGLLDKLDGHYPFIVLSFIIRIIAAVGNASFLTASFAIIAKEFPDNVAITFATLETFFGFGLIVGPTVGGALYQLGGFTLPFALMGATLFLAAILAAFTFPSHADDEEDHQAGPSIFMLLKIPGVLLASASIIVTSMSIGFLQATLEPHLRKFALSPVILGLMFVINGGVYALTAPGFGWVCDNLLQPKVVTVIGTVFVSIAFALIGPAPFLPFTTILWVTILGLVLHGLGMAAQLVSTFTDALRTCVAHGFQNNLETYGLVSGLWTSTFALGAFIGPSISGVLYDKVGFENSSLFVLVCHIVVGVLLTIFLILSRTPKIYEEIKDEKLPNGDTVGSFSKTHPQTAEESIRSSKSLANGISVERSRAPGINSLLVCNSYKGQVWTKREVGSFGGGPYSHSYGTIDLRNNSASFLRGVS